VSSAGVSNDDAALAVLNSYSPSTYPITARKALIGLEPKPQQPTKRVEKPYFGALGANN
jgi:hypothetical protein